MKKSNLWVGLTELVLGLAALAAAFLWVEGPLGSLLCGLGGGLLGSGGNLVWKYWKWTRPQNAERYREKLEQEEIDLRDERKKLLRCKAGLYAYQLGLAVCCLAAFLTSLLGLWASWSTICPCCASWWRTWCSSTRRGSGSTAGWSGSTEQKTGPADGGAGSLFQNRLLTARRA